MRLLLLGADGVLARALRGNAPAEYALDARTHAELDVRDRDGLERALRDARPDWVVNASGYTQVDAAEDHPDEAFAVNAAAVGELGALCASHRCACLHFSTDYVFDGTKVGFYAEEDATAPLSVYGATKLEGEQRLRASGARHCIIRTQWLYGEGGNSFVASLRDRARARTPTSAVADEYGGSTYARDLAEVSWRAVRSGLEGTFHAANRGRVSRYLIAERIFAAFDAADLLTRATASDFPRKARRPRNSPLDVGRIEHALGVRMPDWTDAIDRYVSDVSLVRSPFAPRDPR